MKSTGVLDGEHLDGKRVELEGAQVIASEVHGSCCCCCLSSDGNHLQPNRVNTKSLDLCRQWDLKAKQLPVRRQQTRFRRSSW